MTDFEIGKDPGEHLAGPSRTIQLVEVSVFLFLIVPSMAQSFFTFRTIHLDFYKLALSSVLNDLALLSLVLYFIWRNAEPVQRIGWNFDHLGREIGWGLILFIPTVFGANLLESALRQEGFSAPSTLPAFLGAGDLTNVMLGVIIVSVVAVVEETLFRGYLILRFEGVTGRTGAAILLSSFVFSLGHGYEGSAGAITVFVLGVVFAAIYLWRRSLVAPIVIHFLTDFMSIVLPLL